MATKPELGHDRNPKKDPHADKVTPNPNQDTIRVGAPGQKIEVVLESPC